MYLVLVVQVVLLELRVLQALVDPVVQLGQQAVQDLRALVGQRVQRAEQVLQVLQGRLDQVGHLDRLELSHFNLLKTTQYFMMLLLVQMVSIQDYVRQEQQELHWPLEICVISRQQIASGN